MISVVLDPSEFTAQKNTKIAVCLINSSREIVTNLACKIDMPDSITVLSGSTNIEVLRILPGEKISQTLQILPKAIGSWLVTSSNFSYRDGSGRPHRISDLKCKVKVIKPLSPPPTARIDIKLLSSDINLNQWHKLRWIISNTGCIGIQELTVKVLGKVNCDPDELYIGVLSIGQNKEFSVLANAYESGSNVPVFIEIIFVDSIGRRNTRRISTPLNVIEKVNSGYTYVENQINNADQLNIISRNTFTGDPKVGIVNEAGQQNLSAAALEIQELLTQLSQVYPSTTSFEQMILAAEAIKRIENDSSWKQKIISSLKEGGLSAFEKTLDNPIGALVVGIIKGWLVG